jgi:hypothetical protein
VAGIAKGTGWKEALMKEELMTSVLDFLEEFELVFDNDWPHTCGMLRIPEDNLGVAPSGTFIEPHVDDEGNNWGGRAGLLNSYRKLRQALKEEPQCSGPHTCALCTRMRERRW